MQRSFLGLYDDVEGHRTALISTVHATHCGNCRVLALGFSVRIPWYDILFVTIVILFASSSTSLDGSNPYDRLVAGGGGNMIIAACDAVALETCQFRLVFSSIICEEVLAML